MAYADGYFGWKRARKRPHPQPDASGIERYKRQRMIQDLERLSLTDNDSTSSAGGGLQLVSSIAKKSVANATAAPVTGQDSELSSEADKKIWQRVAAFWRAENMRLTKWVDWPRIIYHSWVAWYQYQISYGMVIDSNCEFDTGTFTGNESDMDIDYDV